VKASTAVDRLIIAAGELGWRLRLRDLPGGYRGSHQQCEK